MLCMILGLLAQCFQQIIRIFTIVFLIHGELDSMRNILIKLEFLSIILSVYNHGLIFKTSNIIDSSHI